MPLIRLLASRVVAKNGGFVSQAAGQIILLAEETAVRMIAAKLGELVPGEVLDAALPAKGAPPPQHLVNATVDYRFEPAGADQAETQAETRAEVVPSAIVPPTGGSIEQLQLNDKLVAALEAAGITTIDQLDAVEDLTSIEGIGRVTADRILLARKRLDDGSTTSQGGD